jgi:hypothetical protein
MIENANVEEEPKNRKVGVSIRNLKKVYKTGNKTDCPIFHSWHEF